jgi:hypothetical protein
MSKEAKEISPKIATEMPKPQFLDDIPSPFGSENKPVGIIAKSLVDGQRKVFVWYDNYSDPKLRDELFVNDLASYMTRQWLGKGTDTIIGPAISLRGSNSKTGKVRVLPDKLSGHVRYGLYVEVSNRVWFNFRGKYVGSEAQIKEMLRVNSQLEVYDQALGKFKSGFPKSSIDCKK